MTEPAYAEAIRDEVAAEPLMRTTFAELVTEAGAGLVADVGCGPGRSGAYLHRLGVPSSTEVRPRAYLLARSRPR